MLTSPRFAAACSGVVQRGPGSWLLLPSSSSPAFCFFFFFLLVALLLVLVDAIASAGFA
jgi:hypothetical protein